MATATASAATIHLMTESHGSPRRRPPPANSDPPTPTTREVELQSTQRIHRPWAIFDGIRDCFRTGDVPDASTEGPAATRLARAAADRHLTGCPGAVGTKTTEIARRMLLKAIATGNPHGHKCHAMMVWQLFAKKDANFYEKQDALIFSVPDVPSDEWHAGPLDLAKCIDKP